MASDVESLIAAHEWCVGHPKELEKHPGKWVAVVDGKVVAAGNTYGIVYKKKPSENSPTKSR